MWTALWWTVNSKKIAKKTIKYEILWHRIYSNAQDACQLLFFFCRELLERPNMTKIGTHLAHLSIFDDIKFQVFYLISFFLIYCSSGHCSRHGQNRVDSVVKLRRDEKWLISRVCGATCPALELRNQKWADQRIEGRKVDFSLNLMDPHLHVHETLSTLMVFNLIEVS